MYSDALDCPFFKVLLLHAYKKKKRGWGKKKREVTKKKAGL